jgi:uncharacterized damage-inducible protein DinB
MRPLAHEFPAYYEQYVDLITEDDVMPVLQRQRDELAAVCASLDDDKARYRYEDGKWSIKEVLGHLTDAERIFATRALCIARGEEQPLPGFDENTYVAMALFDERPLSSIVNEWLALRDANMLLFASFGADDRTRLGIANGKPITPYAIMWIVAGHTVHHLTVLRERYGV